MILKAPTREDCQTIQKWRQRDDVRLGLRTGRILTELEQDRFYENVISNRNAPHRYWSCWESDRFVAFTGLTDIDWEAGHAEISLLVSPDAKGDGVGGRAVESVLLEAFKHLRLEHVFGEVYDHNPALEFWEKQIFRRHGSVADQMMVRIPGRKFWDGNLHGAYLFWFTP